MHQHLSRSLRSGAGGGAGGAAGDVQGSHPALTRWGGRALAMGMYSNSFCLQKTSCFTLFFQRASRFSCGQKNLQNAGKEFWKSWFLTQLTHCKATTDNYNNESDKHVKCFLCVKHRFNSWQFLEGILVLSLKLSDTESEARND